MESLEYFCRFCNNICVNFIDSALFCCFTVKWIASATSRLAKTVKGDWNRHNGVIARIDRVKGDSANFVIARLDEIKSWQSILH